MSEGLEYLMAIICDFVRSVLTYPVPEHYYWCKIIEHYYQSAEQISKLSVQCTGIEVKATYHTDKINHNEPLRTQEKC